MSRVWTKNKRGVRGHRQKKMERWLEDFYKANKEKPEEAQFTLEEMLSACKMDKDHTSDYNCAVQFLGAHRNNIDIVASEFFESGEYLENKGKGESDDMLFGRLVQAGISYGVYPVRSAASVHPGSKDGYRLMTLKDFVEMKQKRMEAICSEIMTVAPLFQTLARKFPEITSAYKPPALPEPDGLVRWTCEECGKTFKTQANLVNHYIRAHNQ